MGLVQEGVRWHQDYAGRTTVLVPTATPPPTNTTRPAYIPPPAPTATRTPTPSPKAVRPLATEFLLQVQAVNGEFLEGIIVENAVEMSGSPYGVSVRYLPP